MGLIGLTNSTLSGLQGKITSDDVLKEVLLAIRQVNREAPADRKGGEVQELLRDTIRTVDMDGGNGS